MPTKLSFWTLAALSLLAFTSTVDGQCNKTIVIISAGVAGLGAAQEAKAKGCNVTVLEVRNRMGGRIYTDTMGTSKIKVDMGASWIHGIGPGLGDVAQYKGKYNPIYELAKKNNISTVATWVDED